MIKNSTLKIRCRESLKEDIRFVAKMEDLKTQTEVIEYLIEQQLRMYKSNGIVRK